MARRIQGNIQYVRCGTDEKSINYVLFECSPAVQIWHFLQIPLNPLIFPTQSIFVNIDHFLKGGTTNGQSSVYIDPIVYLKDQNNKVFNNIETNLRDTIQLAKTEARLWLEPQASLVRQNNPAMEVDTTTLLQILGRNYVIPDGSWKAEDKFSRQGSYSTLKCLMD